MSAGNCVPRSVRLPIITGPGREAPTWCSQHRRRHAHLKELSFRNVGLAPRSGDKESRPPSPKSDILPGKRPPYIC